MSDNSRTKAPQVSDREKSLMEDNKSLKAQLKELETTFNQMQADFSKSIKMRERLDSLCKELQKQTQEIKAENSSHMDEAEGQGNQLAKQVSNNMVLMEDVNDKLSDIMNESLRGKQENVTLTGQVAELKQEFDDRHEKMLQELEAANNDLISTKTELATIRLRGAEDREKSYSEMHRMANELVDARREMKDSKELELELRTTLQGYDEKFTILQGSLQKTNVAYNAFSGDMQSMAKQARALETETMEWQKRWEENNSKLVTITRDIEAIQIEVGRVHESLLKMTNLYHALDKERSSMMKKLGKDMETDPLKDIKLKVSTEKAK